MPARCWGLRLAATLLRIIAWVELAIGVGIGLLALAHLTLGSVPGLGPLPIAARTSAFGGIVVLALALLGFALLYGSSELIHLVLAIEQKTRQLASRHNEPGTGP